MLQANTTSKLTVSGKVQERLKLLGKQKRRSPQWLATEAINQFLDREEAAEQFKQETLRAWNEYCMTGEAVCNEDVIAWLDSWGTAQELETPKCR